jgi:hypothetical protein
VPTTLLVLIVQGMIFGLAGRYPWGGFARQQSFLFPFIILAGFLIVDLFLRAVHSQAARTLICLFLAASIASSFDYHWSRFPRIPEELFAKDYRNFRNAVGLPVSVYLDHFSLVAYFSNTHDWKWLFERHLRSAAPIDEYQTISPSGAKVTVLRNLDSWNFDLDDPAFYKTVAATLSDARIPSTSVFFLKQFKDTTPPNEASEREKIADLSRACGLNVQAIAYDAGHVYMTLTLK